MREAGGFVSDIAGGPDMLNGGSIVAANSQLHAAVQRMMHEALVERGLARTG